MAKTIGAIVLIIGVACLAFGVVFIVQSSSAHSEVIDTIAKEKFPVLEYSAVQYPYLNATSELIDTADEIKSTADALEDARHKITEPLEGQALFGKLFTTPTPMPGVGTLEFHDYASILAFESAMNAARTNMAMASMLQFIGTINVILGIALILTGIVVCKKVA